MWNTCLRERERERQTDRQNAAGSNTAQWLWLLTNDLRFGKHVFSTQKDVFGADTCCARRRDVLSARRWALNLVNCSKNKWMILLSVRHTAACRYHDEWTTAVSSLMVAAPSVYLNRPTRQSALAEWQAFTAHSVCHHNTSHCGVCSDVKFHEFFCPEMFLEIFLKYFKNFTMFFPALHSPV